MNLGIVDEFGATRPTLHVLNNDEESLLDNIETHFIQSIVLLELDIIEVDHFWFDGACSLLSISEECGQLLLHDLNQFLVLI